MTIPELQNLQKTTPPRRDRDCISQHFQWSDANISRCSCRPIRSSNLGCNCIGTDTTMITCVSAPVSSSPSADARFVFGAGTGASLRLLRTALALRARTLTMLRVTLLFKPSGRSHISSTPFPVPLLTDHQTTAMGKSWPFQKTKNDHERMVESPRARKKECNHRYVPLDYACASWTRRGT
jgi:hypothetical protein